MKKIKIDFLDHHEVIQAVRLRDYTNVVANFAAFNINIQKMQINGCDRNTGNKQLLPVQYLSPFTEQIFRKLHVVILHSLYDPAVFGDGIRILNVILPIIHALNRQSLIRLLITFTKRHDDRCQTATVHFLNEVKDVLTKPNHLLVCVAVGFNVIDQPLPVLMPDTDIPAKA